MRPPGKLYILTVALMATLFYIACKKTEVTVNNSNIAVINASPDATGIDFLVNSKLVVENIKYLDSIGYRPTLPGTYNTVLTKTGTTDPLFSFIATLSPSRYYTLFAVDYFKSIKPAIIEDLLVPDTANAKIRFFNFSPNADTVDVLLRSVSPADTILIFSKRRFNDQDSTKSLQRFTTFVPDTCNLLIRRSRDSGFVLQSKNIIFNKATLYTFYLQGIKKVATTPDTLTLKLIQNKP